MRDGNEGVGDQAPITLDRATRDFTLRALGRSLSAIITHTEAARRWVEANVDPDHVEEWRSHFFQRTDSDRVLFMKSEYAVSLMTGIVEAGLRIACNC